MGQNFTADWYAQSYNAATAFGQAEENDNTLKSQFSGAGAPSNAVAGMPWYHSSKGLRVRNAANGAWLKVLQGEASNLTWFFRNATCEGWLIETSYVDMVLAVKGGSDVYNVDGGNVRGSWTITGLAGASENSHTHGLSDHGHSWGTLGFGYGFMVGMGGPGSEGTGPVYTAAGTDQANLSIGPGSSHNHAISHNGGGRPRAAVGTIQYPDLT